MDFLDDLPKRDSSHDTAQAAESAFQAAIDAGQLFVLQQKDRNDYGTDAQIEARDDQEMTNFRVHAQLKGTEAAPNADDSVSVGDISRTNLNYLLAQPDSVYVCLHVPSGRLLVRYAMEVFLETGKDLQRALTHFDAVTHRDPSARTVPAVQAWRAETLFRLGESAAAFRELNNVLASAKGFAWIWPSCARQVAAFGRATTDSTIKALAFWRAYLREHPDDLGAQGEHFLCLAALHADGKPTDTDFHTFKQTAETLIERGLPDAAFLWDRVGHWAQDEEDWENAEQAFRKAYELEPDRYGYCLGTALNFLDRQAEALPILLEQAEKHLPDAMSWFQVAVAREEVGDLPGTIAAYERALELDPDYALAWFSLGGIYWNLRDFSRARETWSEAIARFPEHKEARKLQRDLPFLFDGRKVEMVEEIQPCSPSELEAQIAYLASTPVAGIAQLLASGQCRLSKGVVRSLAVLGSLKTEFGQLGAISPPPTSGEQKFRVAQVLPNLRQLPDGGDLLRRIEQFLQMNEADIEYIVTVLRIGSELIVKDGNARTIAFYERHKHTAEPFAYRVFLVEMVTGNL